MSCVFDCLELEICSLGSHIEMQAVRMLCLDCLDSDWDLLRLLVDCLVRMLRVLKMHMLVDACWCDWLLLVVRPDYYFVMWNYCYDKKLMRFFARLLRAGWHFIPIVFLYHHREYHRLVESYYCGCIIKKNSDIQSEIKLHVKKYVWQSWRFRPLEIVWW